ncbi:DNA-directed RNA polymerase III complex subunit Rpc25 [Coemansia sp. RSA 2703]|nr:DNA-directed RNA polymerase III complex subunit Rpc25 [Coemansia sp. RSA 2703]KAJ2362211.1 DNA-directed RNA polymerase III complex subunit Rpc25 [Coemansia sp. RSA 2607]KAJ2379126.1 DNA-directed RNA polymerase III complex subunit Rpc25 [Coemansia sp. RSA 2603]
MFVLTVLKDTLKILPSDFRKSREEALKDEINRKYANRVLHDIGLCILAHDLLEIDEGYVQHSEGWIWVKVTFRMIVFRPFREEILIGRVRNSNESGIHVSMVFFDDIIIPKECMPEGSEYDQKEGVWVWHFEGSDFYVDNGELIRFSVVESTFLDVNPPRPKKREEEETVASTGRPPFSITGSIAQSGLGLMSWW